MREPYTNYIQLHHYSGYMWLYSVFIVCLSHPKQFKDFREQPGVLAHLGGQAPAIYKALCAATTAKGASPWSVVDLRQGGGGIPGLVKSQNLGLG